MPAQTLGASTTYYEQGNTAPDLLALIEDDGGPINLTGATVTIDISYASWSYYYSPYVRVVTDGPCVVDPDQATNTGYVRWTPQAGDLDIAGNFLYRFRVTYPGGGKATYPANTYLPLVVTTRTGGPS